MKVGKEIAKKRIIEGFQNKYYMGTRQNHSTKYGK